MNHTSNGWKISSEFMKLVKNSNQISQAKQLGAFLPMSNNKGLIIVESNKIGFSRREFNNGKKGAVKIEF